jgi:hypothetical protein
MPISVKRNKVGAGQRASLVANILKWLTFLQKRIVLKSCRVCEGVTTRPRNLFWFAFSVISALQAGGGTFVYLGTRSGFQEPSCRDFY